MKFAFIIIFLAYSFYAFAQKGTVYCSWGYNKEWYTKSDIKIKQTELGNDYVFNDVHASDKPGWDKDLLKEHFTIPQYNYRLGYFYKENEAIELNFDHTKYNVNQEQFIKITGKYNGRNMDTLVYADSNRVLTYQLNNGANFFLFNHVNRITLKEYYKGNVRFDFLFKKGIGFMVPHVENTIMGYDNDPHFQLSGWNVGMEAGVKVSLFKYFYLEFTNKFDYARYRNLRIYNGTAKQAFGTFELILNAGFNIPILKKKEVPQ